MIGEKVYFFFTNDMKWGIIYRYAKKFSKN